MNEDSYKKEMVVILRSRRWHVQEHEDRQSLFIPDLSLARDSNNHWWEVKYRDRAPPTLNSVKHWTKGQEDWLIKRGEAGGGMCFLIFGVPGLNVAWQCMDLKHIRYMRWNYALERAYAKTPSLDSLICALGER